MAKKTGKKKGGKDKNAKGKDKNDKEKIKLKLKEPKEEKKKVDEPCIFKCAKDKITYRPNSYPGLLSQAKTMAVVDYQRSFNYDGFCKLLHSGLRCADRVYVIVPWGKYVIFQAQDDQKITYYLFDGCTCNVNHFRYLDLTCGTAGLLYFEDIQKVIKYIVLSRSRREEIQSLRRCVVDDATNEVYGPNHI